jgi:hypothetical protein
MLAAAGEFPDKMTIMDVVVSPGCVRPAKENLKDRMLGAMPLATLRARELAYEELYCEVYDWVRDDSTGQNEQHCRQFRSDLRFRVVVRLAIGCSAEGRDLNLSASVIEGAELRRRLEGGGIEADPQGKLRFQPDQDYTSISAQHVVKFASWPELEHAFARLMDRVLEVPTVEFASDLPLVRRGTRNVVMFHRVEPRRPGNRSFFPGNKQGAQDAIHARILEISPAQRREICGNPDESWSKLTAEVHEGVPRTDRVGRQDRLLRLNAPREVKILSVEADRIAFTGKTYDTDYLVRLGRTSAGGIDSTPEYRCVPTSIPRWGIAAIVSFGLPVDLVHHLVRPDPEVLPPVGLIWPGIEISLGASRYFPRARQRLNPGWFIIPSLMLTRHAGVSPCPGERPKDCVTSEAIVTDALGVEVRLRAVADLVQFSRFILVQTVDIGFGAQRWRSLPSVPADRVYPTLASALGVGVGLDASTASAKFAATLWLTVAYQVRGILGAEAMQAGMPALIGGPLFTYGMTLGRRSH